MSNRFLLWVGLLSAMFLQEARADDRTWCLVTDSDVAIAMNQVSCLVAADDEVTFCVVLTDGSVVDNVRKAFFEKRVATSIKIQEVVPICVSRDLSLDGISPDTPVVLYDTSGKLVLRGVARLLTVSSLPTGIYIVHVNNTSFKINKQ